MTPRSAANIASTASDVYISFPHCWPIAPAMRGQPPGSRGRLTPGGCRGFPRAGPRGGFAIAQHTIGMINPKFGSWRPAVVWQIADIMSYGQETRDADATGG